MKKAIVLALAAFSLVGYQAFAQESEEPEIIVENPESSALSSKGFKVSFNETEEENEASLNKEPEDKTPLALNEEPEEDEPSLA